jgi:DNA-binding IclR family transcriptional regulator
VLAQRIEERIADDLHRRPVLRVAWTGIFNTVTTMSDLPAPSDERSVLRRGLSILECFAHGESDKTIAELCRRTGLPPATVHRLLAVLVDWGGVERVSRGKYRLAVRVWRLGAHVPRARTLRDVALPYLEDLYEATHALVHLAIVDGIEVLYIEKISGQHAVPVSSSVGGRLPLHASGPGKVLVAFGPPDLLDQVLAAGLKPRTKNTITDEATFRRTLSEIRKTGFVVSREEMSRGISSVAAPIFAGRQAVASVSVVTTPERLDVAVLTPLTTTIARAITRALARVGEWLAPYIPGPVLSSRHQRDRIDRGSCPAFDAQR